MTENNEFDGFAMAARMFFMFLVGLELDIPYLWRSRRSTVLVTLGGGLSCALLALISSNLIYSETNSPGSRSMFVIFLIMIYANTASPLLVHMAAEFKLATSGIGRLVISAALVNDMVCLLGVASMGRILKENRNWAVKILMDVSAIGLIVASGYMIRPVVRWMNRRYKDRKGLKHSEVLWLLTFVGFVAILTDMLGYSGMMTCFVMGVTFPREGRAARTLLQQLVYPVHHYILPVYFCFTGFHADLTTLNRASQSIPIINIVVLSTIGKVGGTLLVTRYLKMPVYEGLALGFMLNVKGHIDIIVISVAKKQKLITDTAYNMLIMAAMLNTIITGPIITLIVKKERKRLAYYHIGVEWQPQESELRTLACVHRSAHVPTMMKLIDASRGTNRSPATAYLLQLIELTDGLAADILYHQRDEDFEDEYKYGNEDSKLIYDTVDTYTDESGVSVRQMKALSTFENMYEDVCNAAEEIRASIIILPFHNRQCVDGRMELDKEGCCETTNYSKSLSC
ncbi:cation/H(+) antiporter 19-like [Tasmannia lanceolata]|uniref:cation/H(+) antiporter 19-like n=1 Tax=Tasmannia lanceolata TaxID=3420 RepID=UPI004062C745